jgi:hypothetical protein
MPDGFFEMPLPDGVLPPGHPPIDGMENDKPNV